MMAPRVVNRWFDAYRVPLLVPLALIAGVSLGPLGPSMVAAFSVQRLQIPKAKLLVLRHTPVTTTPPRNRPLVQVPVLGLLGETIGLLASSQQLDTFTVTVTDTDSDTVTVTVTQQQQNQLCFTSTHRSPTGTGDRPSLATRMRLSLQRCIRYRAAMVHMARKWAITVLVVTMLWVATAGYHTPPVLASPTVATTDTATVTQTPSHRLLRWSASLDEMVDRYVKDHMFDDDVYDPIESAYRETHDDIITGTYPTKLQDVTASVLGKAAAMSARTITTTGSSITHDNMSSSNINNNKVIAVFLRASNLLIETFGLSETTAQVMLAVTAFAGSFFSFVALFGGISFILKQNLKRELKKRYGDDYSTDASDIKDSPTKPSNDGDDDGNDSDNDNDVDDE